MKKIGSILILDSVTSMPRDRINFEDRIISSFKHDQKNAQIFSRAIVGKTAPTCLNFLRRRSADYSCFVKSMDEVRAYILLGLAEEVHQIPKKWFETTVHNIIDELRLLNIEPCLVSCRKKSSQVKKTLQKVSEGRKQVYVNAPPWNMTACYSLTSISRQRSVDIIKCDVSLKNQWDTLSIQSVRKLTKLISSDLVYFSNG